jgi:LEA14-like dessication related protein
MAGKKVNIDKVLFWSLLATITGAIAYVGIGLYRQKQLLSQNTYKIKNVSVVTFDTTADNAVLLVYVQINNQTDVALDLNAYDFDVTIDNNEVAKVSSRMQQHIYAKSSTTIAIRVQFKPNEAMKGLGNDIVAVLDKTLSGVNLELKGTVSVSHVGIPLPDYPVDMTYTLKELISGS